MSKNKGFSLVELIIVIAIIAILSAALAPQIMKYIESEMIKTNEECGKLHFNCDLRLWQDKQLELETIERIYEELNIKFFDGKL